MKKILIVHAHPESNSFCSSLKNTAIDYFKSIGAEVKISDLYQLNFNPIGDKHDFTQLDNVDFFKYQLEQVHAYQQGLFEPSLQTEMDKLEWCDMLIFSFPLWWFGMPAILKGWVDRVFAMGFVYGAGKGVYDNGVYPNKKAFLTFTTGGPEVAYSLTGKNGNLDTILYPIHHGMLYFIGMQVLPPFMCYSPARMSEEDRANELIRYKTYLSKVCDEEPLYK